MRLCCISLWRQGQALCLRSSCLGSHSINQTPKCCDKLHPFASVQHSACVKHTDTHVTLRHTRRCLKYNTKLNMIDQNQFCYCDLLLACYAISIHFDVCFNFIIPVRLSQDDIGRNGFSLNETLRCCYCFVLFLNNAFSVLFFFLTIASSH